MAEWKYFPEDVPDDEQNCWIRLGLNPVHPFTAVYNTASQSFITTGEGIVFPAWSVFKWKPV